MPGKGCGALTARSSPAAHTFLGPLTERDFRLFFIGRAGSLLGSAMAMVAMSFAVLDEGRAVADVGYVTAAGTVPLVVLLLFGGVVADRLPSRTVMVGADLGRCAIDLLLAGLLLSGTPPLWVIMVLAGVLGAGGVLRPGVTGLVPALTGSEHIQQANALVGVAESTGQVVGPALAGVVVAAGGAGWAIVVQFGLFSLVVYAPFLVLGAGVAYAKLGGAAAWGAILTAQAVGSVVGGLVVMRLHPRRPLVTATFGTFAFAAPVALLAMAAPVAWTAGAAALSGAGIAVFGALWTTTIQQRLAHLSSGPGARGDGQGRHPAVAGRHVRPWWPGTAGPHALRGGLPLAGALAA